MLRVKYEEFIPALIEETKLKFLGKGKTYPKLDFENENVLIGVRGISVLKNKVVLNEDTFDRFNDILFNIYPGGKSWGLRVVTMDPGKVSKETLLKYGVTKGEARTEEGLYSVKFGIHKGHEALVQASPFYFRRDQNNDHIWNELDPIFLDQVGLNIHARNSNSESVSISSLGCTVTKAAWNDPEWLELIGIFKSAELEAMKKNPKFMSFCYAVHNQDTARKILQGETV
ncbi:hypothetical protein [Leptospira santarosai]|uniref:hypothetical protein n=1 Tax=Leptospira santarosai TaxID=28183 RepID=UPI0026E29E90|nr:hypothetical protein [Leptospira santarosai]MDO6383293.1 hypothetical protein [Leptospira santarosai]